MFREKATLKFLFKMCVFEVYHHVSFFEGAALLFLVQHHKLGHDLGLFLRSISPSVLIFLFAHR